MLEEGWAADGGVRGGWQGRLGMTKKEVMEVG